MRIVYDDAKQGELVDVLDSFFNGLNVKPFLEEEYGSQRIQEDKVKRRLNTCLGAYGMRIGDRAAHDYGIGNNCSYHVFFQPKGAKETQHCANLCLTTGMFGELFVSVEDYEGRLVSPVYELDEYGIKKSRGTADED